MAGKGKFSFIVWTLESDSNTFFSHAEKEQMIHGQLASAVNFFYSQHDQHFKLLNTARLILIPKKEVTKKLSDFRPISLTHSIAKLISKVL
jgi:hypothetical protein